jgi:uncharacterized membrane protein
MNTFSASETLAWGWATFKSRWQFFVGVVALTFLISLIIGAIGGAFPEGPREGFALWAVGFALTGILSTFLNIGVTHFWLGAHDASQEANVGLLWFPRPFWKYLGASILAALVVLAGFVLLIVPGIIAALALSFVSFVVVDRDLSPIKALQESARITKGRRLELLLFFLLLLVINILGAVALLVGLLVSVPVSHLAMTHAYRTLAASAPAKESAVA